MTEKSNDLSDKDKVTQNSENEESKGIKKEISLDSENSDDPHVENTEAQSETPQPSQTTSEVTEEVESAAEATESAEVDAKDVDEKVAANTADTGQSADNKKDSETVEGSEEEVKEVEPTVAPKKEATESAELDAKDVEEKVAANTAETGQSTDHKEDSENTEESEEEEGEEEIDLTELSKLELLALLKTKVKTDKVFQVDRLINDIKVAFEAFTDNEKAEALELFKEEGGQEDDFDFRPSEEEKEFNTHYFEFKRQLNTLKKDTEKRKESNLALKTDLLNRLRDLVDGEETTLSMSTIKAIQEDWKSIGQVPAAQNRSLWANYNALMDRFYDNRSIYFELKELDRKKNLESKTELCEKAESLKDVKDLKEAIKSLNDLHEEYKHIGPVPRDEQEALWQRFKGASDAVYERRKVFYDGQKEVFQENQKIKEELIETLKLFTQFKADRIRDWNSKTKEILEIQKTWEKTGPVPRESGKEINKAFWASFKNFFYNKNLFFKELDEIRATNQEKAEQLISKAEELKDNTDWQNTSNALVKLQQEWKKLGPTPEKHRDSLYKRFKAACDSFFDNRRSANKQANEEYDINLTRKKEVCESIKAAASGEAVSEEELTKLVGEFNEIGFVPRKAMKDIQAEFKSAVDVYLEKLGPEGDNRENFLFRLNLNRIQSDPNSNKTLNKKEHGIRKQISELENNITLWKTNLEFFASSKTADKLKDQFDVKIQKAEEEIGKLKSKLAILREF